MRKIKVPSAGGYILAALLTLLNTIAISQAPPSATFALQHGERVVFVGNSLFENEILQGYLELALTTRWPDRNVTFRNIGWTGDTVFGEARSYFTNPPTPYELLMKQLTDAKPTVVFVAYGAIEAQKGEEGLAEYTEGLGKLLDKIKQVGAQAVLLSPIPLFSGDTPENTASRNVLLERYASVTARMASERGSRYLDLLKPMREISQKATVSDNGFHLNESGYYHLASVLEKGLGLTPRSREVLIEVSKQGTPTSATATLLNPAGANSELTFTLNEKMLPLPSPKGQKEFTANQVLKITGLKKGYYTLTADGAQIVTASAREWAEGVAIVQGPLYTQANQLREMIVNKNELFFHQYRPQNRTYIIGFRSYEQGRHARGLKDLGLIITWLEGQIALHRLPKSPVYQLTQLN